MDLLVGGEHLFFDFFNGHEPCVVGVVKQWCFTSPAVGVGVSVGFCTVDEAFLGFIGDESLFGFFHAQTCVFPRQLGEFPFHGNVHHHGKTIFFCGKEIDFSVGAVDGNDARSLGDFDVIASVDFIDVFIGFDLGEFFVQVDEVGIFLANQFLTFEGFEHFVFAHSFEHEFHSRFGEDEVFVSHLDFDVVEVGTDGEAHGGEG